MSADLLTSPSRAKASASAHRPILHAATWVGLATLLVKIAGTLKESVVAFVYGRSDSLDAFLAALLIPNLLVNLIGESMNQALVPTLIEVRERDGKPAALQLLSSAMLALSLLLTAAALLMALLAPLILPVIASNFASAKLHLAIRIFLCLLPVVLITGLATNCTAVINSCDRFLLPALAPVLISLAMIFGAWFWGQRYGIWALVAALVAGSLLQLIVVAFQMQIHGYPFHFVWQGTSAAVRTVSHQYGVVLLSGLVSSAGLIVDQSMAAMLAPGSVAALAYANRFVSVVLTLSAGALSTAVVPSFARMIARRDWLACQRTVEALNWRTGLAALAVTLPLIAGAPFLIRLFLEHGAFHAADTAVVSRVLIFYALQIPFYVASRADYRLLLAMRRADLVLVCGSINLALDVLLNFILMRSMGVAGIALATSLWTASTFLFLRYWRRKLLAEAIERDQPLLGASPSVSASSTSKAVFLLRFDDLCPTMQRGRLAWIEQLVYSHNLKPILAIVPNNSDPELEREPAIADFWPRLQSLASHGATIGLHGLHHLPESPHGGLLPLHSSTEFAGVRPALQQIRIHEGLRILRSHGLDPAIWVAPCHGFDQNTLAALRAEGFTLLSDGFHTAPCIRGGMIWLPQQLWDVLPKSTGLWTICLHPDTMNEEQFSRLLAFHALHSDSFLSVEQALLRFPPRPFTSADWMRERLLVQRFRLKSILSGLRR